MINKQKKVLSLFFAACSFVTLNVTNLQTKSCNIIAKDSEVSPIAYYKFEDANDLGKDSMDNVNLLPSNPYYKGKISEKGGMEISGYGYYANIGKDSNDFSDYLNDYTISLKFDANGVNSVSRIISSGQYNSNEGLTILYDPSGETPHIRTWLYYDKGVNPNNNGYYGNLVEIDPTIEHSYVLSVSNSEKKAIIFLDGKKIADVSANYSFSMNAIYQTFTIGGVVHTGNCGNADVFNGRVDDVRIYGFAMNENQMTALYNKQAIPTKDISKRITSIESLKERVFHPLERSGRILKNLSDSIKITANDKELQAHVDWYDLIKDEDGKTATAYGLIYKSGYNNEYGFVAKQKIRFAENGEMKLSLLDVFCDNMVLQRGNSKIVGYANDELITVKLGDYKEVKQQANNGTFSIVIPNTKASSVGVDLVVSGSKSGTITIKNVLIGEVWLGSGQSNMAYEILHTKEGEATYESLKNASYTNLRYYKVSNNQQTEKEDKSNITSNWIVPKDYTDLSLCSIYATSFGLELVNKLRKYEGQDVPVGIIGAAIGGSMIEQWLDKESIENTGSVTKQFGLVDSVYFNGMINPLKGLAIKGVLWYQGETNASETTSNMEFGKLYKEQSVAYAKLMRKTFNDDNLPIIITMLPQFRENPNNQGGRENTYWLPFREIQRQIAFEDKNTYINVGIDTGELRDIHPTKDKYLFASRAASIAAREIYGDMMEASQSPYPIKAIYKDGKVIISFKRRVNLKTDYSRAIDGLEIKYSSTGNYDNILNASLKDNTIVIPVFQKPASIRYFNLLTTEDYYRGGVDQFNYIRDEYRTPIMPFEINVSEENERNVYINSNNGAIKINGTSLENNYYASKQNETISVDVIANNGYEADYALVNGVKKAIANNKFEVNIQDDTFITIIYKKTEVICNIKTDEGVVISGEKTIKSNEKRIVEISHVSKRIREVRINGEKVDFYDNKIYVMGNDLGKDIVISVTLYD